MSAAPAVAADLLPLFPLRSVLFPGGLLQLKVFEARYLDLVSRCLREGKPFGVVCLRQGTEVQVSGGEPALFETVGVLARVDDVDSERPGILRVRCTGGGRFRLGESSQGPDGLWQASWEALPDDAAQAPTPEQQPTVRALSNAIDGMRQQGAEPFATPYRFDDAGWVANRWCEILPIPLAARQKLLELDDAATRLQLVGEFLRSRGVID